MSYRKLKLKKILFSNSSVTEEMIINALEKSYKNCAFSTFPYYFEHMGSFESMTNFKSGNCVSLSLYLKNYLKDMYSIKSYLIPATIPNKYRLPGYLDISHVALAIPINKKSFFIADPAFYFLNPIRLDVNNSDEQVIFAKKIYHKEFHIELRDYTTIDKIVCSTKKLDTDLILHKKYQQIPKNTFYSECYITDNIKDKWCYFIIEVLNPDIAISSFFYRIKNEPFICSTTLDHNGIPQLDVLITLRNGNLVYSKNLGEKKSIPLDNISDTEIFEIDNELYPFVKGRLINYLKN